MPKFLADEEQQWVHFAPPELINRQSSEWQGLRADVVTAVRQEPFEYTFASPQHLLIAAEHSERDDGETLVEGLPRSTLRSLSGRLTFVPAGHKFYGWQNPRVLTRVNYFYIDPHGPLLDNTLRFDQMDFRPRLFFFDPEIWQLAIRLKQQTINANGPLPLYAEALSVLLAHELVRLNGGAIFTPARGGLTGLQRKRVANFIEENLARDVKLSEVAAVAELSPYHFARVFKQSFGVPPHRYHIGRRIERAKEMLSDRSVTEVALAVGFAETSSFSAAFRRATGVTPSEFRRRTG
ncbi:MAG: AraC family transcriptional regulator [Pseudolabrys sp.]